MTVGAATSEAPPKVSYRALLQVRGYPELLAAQAVSRVGDSVHYIALVALIFALTGSGLAVSGAVVFEALPVLLFGALAGAVVDRLPRRRVMIAADVGRAVLAVLMAQTTSVAAIYALAFGLALGGVFHGPASQSLVPAVVPERILGRANALTWSSVQSSHVLGAALGGATIALVGASGAFLLNAATFLLSALLLLRVPEPADAGSTKRTTRLRTEARHGLDFIRGDRFIVQLIAVQLLAVLSVGGTGALLVVLANRQLGVDEADFGLLVAAIGVGAVIGPLLFGRLVDRIDSPVLVFIPYLVRGLIDAALAFVTGLWVPITLLLVYGINTSTGGVAYTTLLQRRVPAELRGRVFSAFNVVWQAGRLASLALAGILADVVSVQAVYVIAGVLLVLAGLIGLNATRTTTQEAARTGRSPGDPSAKSTGL
jgi:MFS family permease